MTAELTGSAPVLIRRSTLADAAALARLTSSSSEATPCAVFLVAEVRGELVAAAPIEGEGGVLYDPDRASEDIRDLLTRWSEKLRRQLGTAASKAA